MKTTRLVAILLLLSMIQVGCTDNAGKEQPGAQANADKVIYDISPKQNETVSLVTPLVLDFLDGYYFGKGPATVSSPDALPSNNEQLHQDVTFSWSCSADSSGYTLTYGTKADLSDAITVDTPVAKATVAGLLVSKTYYWQVTVHGEEDLYSEIYSFRTADTPRIISITGVTNTRDIGGYLTEDGEHRVVQGMIYRGGYLDNISGDGMAQATQVYRIRTDLDLRSPTSDTDHMLHTDRSPLFQGVNYINISGIGYSSIFDSPDRMRQELEVFTHKENYPIYVHCKAGRDRTGTLVYILGALLGVPEETLLADYELTYLTRYAYASGEMSGHNNMADFLTLFHLYQGDTLQQKAESYCLSIGLAQQQIQTIRDILLEKEE